SSRVRHTRSKRDWSSDVCSSDLDLHRATLEEAPALGDPVDLVQRPPEGPDVSRGRPQGTAETGDQADAGGRGVDHLVQRAGEGRSEERRVGKTRSLRTMTIH